MNGTSGKFTAPRDWIYSFSFTGFAQFPPSSLSDDFLGVSMYHLNGNVTGWGSADGIGTASQFEKFSFQSTLSNPKQESALFGRYWWFWLNVFELFAFGYGRRSNSVRAQTVRPAGPATTKSVHTGPCLWTFWLLCHFCLIFTPFLVVLFAIGIWHLRKLEC